MRRSHLTIELSNHCRDKNERDPRLNQKRRQICVIFNIFTICWSSSKIDDKHQHEHNELPPHQVTIQVVSSVTHFANPKSNRVTLFKQTWVYWWESYHGCLRSFHSSQPRQGEEHCYESKPIGDIRRKFRILLKDHARNDNNRVDESNHRSRLLQKIDCLQGTLWNHGDDPSSLIQSQGDWEESGLMPCQNKMRASSAKRQRKPVLLLLHGFRFGSASGLNAGFGCQNSKIQEDQSRKFEFWVAAPFQLMTMLEAVS